VDDCTLKVTDLLQIYAMQYMPVCTLGMRRPVLKLKVSDRMYWLFVLCKWQFCTVLIVQHHVTNQTSEAGFCVNDILYVCKCVTVSGCGVFLRVRISGCSSYIAGQNVSNVFTAYLVSNIRHSVDVGYWRWSSEAEIVVSVKSLSHRSL